MGASIAHYSAPGHGGRYGSSSAKGERNVSHGLAMPPKAVLHTALKKGFAFRWYMRGGRK